MKTFTVKDFIQYNSPCFSCGKSILITAEVIVSTLNNYGSTSLFPIISPTQTEIDLKITYDPSFSFKLIIDHKTNKFKTNNLEGLTNYLQEHKIFLSSKCKYCYTEILTQNLDFDVKRGFIKPVEISSEILMTSDSVNNYQVESSSVIDDSLIIIDRIDKATPAQAVRINASLLSLHKFKNKEHFINKLKTYLTFS